MSEQATDDTEQKPNDVCPECGCSFVLGVFYMSEELQLNVTYEGGEAVSIRHETRHVAPPKSAWWVFKIEDSVAVLSRRAVGCRRVSEEYIVSLEESLLELPFVESVNWDKNRNN